MACREDDSPISLLPCDCHLGRRRCGEPDVDDITSHSEECPRDDAVDHDARDAGISPHDDQGASLFCLLADEGGIGSCELRRANWVEAIGDVSTDSPSYTRDGLDECHKVGRRRLLLGLRIEGIDRLLYEEAVTSGIVL